MLKIIIGIIGATPEWKKLAIIKVEIEKKRIFNILFLNNDDWIIKKQYTGTNT